MIVITEHAIVRYGERIRSVYDATPKELRRFRVELQSLIGQGVLTTEQPEWVAVSPEEELTLVRRASHYLLITDDICIPIQSCGRMVGLTVLTRGNISALRRAKRNERKQERRRAIAAQRAHKSWLGERNPRWL